MKLLKKMGVCFLCLLLACSLVLTACKKDETPADPTPTAEGGEEKGGNGGNEGGNGGNEGNNEQPQKADYSTVAAAIAANDSTVIKLLAQVSSKAVKTTADPTDPENGKETVNEQAIEALVDLLNGNADVVLTGTEDGETELSKYFLREWLAVFGWEKVEDEDKEAGEEQDEQESEPTVGIANPYQMYLVTTLPELKEKGNAMLPMLMAMLQYYMGDNGDNGDNGNGGYAEPAQPLQDQPIDIEDGQGTAEGGVTEQGVTEQGETEQGETEQGETEQGETEQGEYDLVGMLLDSLIPADKLFAEFYGSGVEALINLAATYDAVTLADGKLTIDLNKLVYGIAGDVRALVNSVDDEITLIDWLKSDTVTAAAENLFAGINAADLRQSLVDEISEAIKLAPAFLPTVDEEPAEGDEQGADGSEQGAQGGEEGKSPDAVIAEIIERLSTPEAIGLLLPAPQEGQTAYAYLISLLDQTSGLRVMLNVIGYDEDLEALLTTPVATLIAGIAKDDEGKPVDWKAEVLSALDVIGEDTINITEEPTVVYTLNEEALPQDLKEQLALAREWGYGTPSQTDEPYEIWDDYRDYYTETKLEADTTAISGLKVSFVLNAAGGANEVQFAATAVNVSHKMDGSVKTETVNASATLQLGAAADFADISNESCVVGEEIADHFTVTPSHFYVESWVQLPNTEEDTYFAVIVDGLTIDNGALADVTVGLYEYGEKDLTFVQAIPAQFDPAMGGALTFTLTVLGEEYDEEKGEWVKVEKEEEYTVYLAVRVDEGDKWMRYGTIEDGEFWSSGQFLMPTEPVYETVANILAGLQAETDPAVADQVWE